MSHFHFEKTSVVFWFSSLEEATGAWGHLAGCSLPNSRGWVTFTANFLQQIQSMVPPPVLPPPHACPASWHLEKWERDRDAPFTYREAERPLTKCDSDCHRNSFALLHLPTCTSREASCESPRCTSPLRLNLGVATTSSVYLILLADRDCCNLTDFDYVSLWPSLAEGIGTHCSQNLILRPVSAGWRFVKYPELLGCPTRSDLLVSIF